MEIQDASPLLRPTGRVPGQPAVPRMPTETVTIVSVFPKRAFSSNYTWCGVGSQGTLYEIQENKPCEKHAKAPCKKCRQYAKLVVGWARQPVDDPLAGDNSRRRFEMINCRELAESLLSDNCVDRGIFIASGAEPTDAELDEAIRAYEIWAEETVTEADKQWSRKRDSAMINPHAVDAAKYLGHTREWTSDTSAKQSCEACGELVRKGTTICKCGYPVDFQKAYDMGLLNEKLEAFGRKSGKINVHVVEEATGIEDVVPVEAEPAIERKPRKRKEYGA